MKKDDIDKIRGLGLGADDYMTKPFNILEVKARIKAKRMQTTINLKYHIRKKIKPKERIEITHLATCGN